MPIVAVMLLTVTGNHSVVLPVPALAGLVAPAAAIVAFGLVMARKSYAYRIGAGLGQVVSRMRKLVPRPPVTGWGEAAVRFRCQTNDLVTCRWLALTITTVASHIGLYLVLLLACGSSEFLRHR